MSPAIEVKVEPVSTRASMAMEYWPVRSLMVTAMLNAPMWPLYQGYQRKVDNKDCYCEAGPTSARAAPELQEAHQQPEGPADLEARESEKAADGRQTSKQDVGPHRGLANR